MLKSYVHWSLGHASFHLKRNKEKEIKDFPKILRMVGFLGLVTEKEVGSHMYLVTKYYGYYVVLTHALCSDQSSRVCERDPHRHMKKISTACVCKKKILKNPKRFVVVNAFNIIKICELPQNWSILISCFGDQTHRSLLLRDMGHEHKFLGSVRSCTHQLFSKIASKFKVGPSSFCILVTKL